MRAHHAVPGGRRFESLALPFCAFGVVGVWALGVSLGYSDVDVWGAFVVPTILLVITLPFLAQSRWLRKERLVGIASVALAAKFIGAYLRYLVEYHVYSGADSRRYHANGVRIAEEFLDGERSLASLVPASTGTAFIDEINGIVALLSGRTVMASFMVFSWLAYLGVLGFIAAARRALPAMPLRGYAVAVLFLPSMLFWSSALGKDAWMVFGMGLFALGAALLSTGLSIGSAPLLAGGYFTAAVRPHVTVLLVIAVAVSLLGRTSHRSRFGSFLLLLLVAALASVASGFASGILPSYGDGIGAVLESTRQFSTTGGSAIEVVTVNPLIDYPLALVTVLFRPFVFEASSAVQFLSALEGTFLLIWTIYHLPRVLSSVRLAPFEPWIRLSILYVLAFGFAWSSLGNLGIIVRQRVQVLPLLLVLFFAATASSRGEHREGDGSC